MDETDSVVFVISLLNYICLHYQPTHIFDGHAHIVNRYMCCL